MHVSIIKVISFSCIYKICVYISISIFITLNLIFKSKNIILHHEFNLVISFILISYALICMIKNSIKL